MKISQKKLRFTKSLKAYFWIKIAILIIVFTPSCSKEDKNPLIIPPNFSEVPDLNKIDNNNNKENIGNQENIDKLKKLLQESD